MYNRNSTSLVARNCLSMTYYEYILSCLSCTCFDIQQVTVIILHRILHFNRRGVPRFVPGFGTVCFKPWYTLYQSLGQILEHSLEE